MAKLCPKGKAAAKRKFKVYPSAYANMYASKVCKGKVRASAKRWWFHCTRLWQSNVKPKKENEDCLMGDLKKWVNREMGGHWSSKKRWQISTLWKKIINRFKKKIPEVRPTCESHTDDKRAKRPLLSNENEQPVIQAANLQT